MTMLLPPPIQTERLLVRVPTTEDAAAIARFEAENREHLAPWEPSRAERTYTAAHHREALETVPTDIVSGRRIPFVFQRRDSDEIIGDAALSNVVRGVFQAAHLGFGLAREAQGQGYMHEALTAVIRFAFDELNLHRLMANHQPHNARSAAVLARLGFEVEGRAKAYLFLNGEWRDHVLTALTNDSWQASRDE